MTRNIRRGVGVLVALPIALAASVTPAIPVLAQDAACAVTVWGDEITHLAIIPAAEAYTAETGVKVDVQNVPFSEIWGNYETQVPAGTGPDLIVAPHSNMAKWVQSGLAAPLELGDKLGEFDAGAAAAAQVDGKAYMVPLWPENIALIRNTDLVPDAVATMDELIAVGQPLVDAGTVELVMALPQDPNNGNPYLVYPFQTSMGGALFGTKEDGSYDYTNFTGGSEGGLAFAAELAELASAGILNPDVGYDIALDRFLNGKAAYVVTGPWDLPAIRDAGIKYSVDLLPTTGDQPAAPWVGYFGLVLNPKATCALAATDFATRFMATKEAQIMVFEKGAYPPAHTAAFQEVAEDPDVKAWGENGAFGQPLITDPTVDGIVWKDWGPVQVAIQRGQGDPADLWKQWANKVQSELDAAGY